MFICNLWSKCCWKDQYYSYRWNYDKIYLLDLRHLPCRVVHNGRFLQSFERPLSNKDIAGFRTINWLEELIENEDARKYRTRHVCALWDELPGLL